MRILSLFMLFIISCQKPVPCKNTAYLDGKTYLYGDLFTGECISAHKNGEIKSIMRYKGGVDDGEWRYITYLAKMKDSSQNEKGLPLRLSFSFNAVVKMPSSLFTSGWFSSFCSSSGLKLFNALSAQR